MTARGGRVTPRAPCYISRMDKKWNAGNPPPPGPRPAPPDKAKAREWTAGNKELAERARRGREDFAAGHYREI